MNKDEKNIIHKEKLLEELEWVKYRIHMLDIIERKLYQMKTIAQESTGNLSKQEREELNKKIKYLEMQVNALDEESRHQ
ncbi:MAG: hypothetical protein F8N39_13375 [Clostridiaceae bacterium]|nr:hypothetical protein [Clostridiaceae bacterium]